MVLLRIVLPAIVVCTLVLGACGDGPSPSEEALEPTATTGRDDGDTDEARYRVVLSGAVRDTLRGSAYFQVLYSPPTDDLRLVFELRGSTPVSGFYLARPDTSLPQPDVYEVVAVDKQGTAVDQDPPDDAFRVLYRQGLRRVLMSETGTVSFEQVSDTLVAGSFDVELRGVIVRPSGGLGERPQEGSIRAQGRFRAVPGGVGYVVGF